MDLGILLFVTRSVDTKNSLFPYTGPATVFNSYLHITILCCVVVEMMVQGQQKA